MNFLLYISLLLTTLSCTVASPERGQKIGRIIKISDQGLLCETCEVELIRGGFVDGSGSMGGSFKFTIENSILKELAYEAFEKQYEIIVTYETEFITSIFRSEKYPARFAKSIQITSIQNKSKR